MNIKLREGFLFRATSPRAASPQSLLPWILLLTSPDTLTRVIFRPLMTIKVIMTMFIFRQKSRTYFALEWSGWLFVFNTLPFGWKAGAYLYHSIGLVATSYIRSHGVPCSRYIDDRHFGQLQIRRNAPPCSWSDFQRAQAALYIACYILIDLGYFIGLKKSTLVPTFLGYIVDSVKTGFLMPPDKKIKFASLREDLLSHKTVSLKSLQKFVGKINSFTLVVPAARLFSCVACLAMSRASKSLRAIPVSRELKAEFEHWRFLNSWSRFLP